jgi:uncharacterized protein (DUF1810 family)
MEKTLDRFLMAQATTYRDALGEIQSGHKKGHWMWFIFPQIHGLGLSETSKYYAIQNLEEAKAYLNHAVLGRRVLEITHALLALDQSDPKAIFGSPDDMKLKSCMTLFATATEDKQSIFQKVLDKFYNGVMDQKTLEMIKSSPL